MLEKISSRYRDKKIPAIVCRFLIFHGVRSLVGSFEECVPLVPIAIALALSMGWDTMVGLGMSLLAVGCGFSTGICNPFYGWSGTGTGRPSHVFRPEFPYPLVCGYLYHSYIFPDLICKKVERTNLNNVSLQEVLFCKMRIWRRDCGFCLYPWNRDRF